MFESISQIPASIDGNFLKKPVRRCVLEFGGLLFGFSCLVALYSCVWGRGGSYATWWLIIGGGLFGVGWLLPSLLFQFWRLWMLLALMLNKVMTPLILYIMWYLVVTPTAIVLRLCGVDLMCSKFPDETVDSYFKEISPKDGDFELLKRQF